MHVGTQMGTKGADAVTATAATIKSTTDTSLSKSRCMDTRAKAYWWMHLGDPLSSAMGAPRLS